MQLHLDRAELQLLADVLELRQSELREVARDRPADASLARQLADFAAVLDGVNNRRLQFDADQLDMLNALLGEFCRRALPKGVEEEQRHHRLESLRDKIAEVCAMI